MEQNLKMMEEIEVQDTELTKKVAKMNSSPKDKKMGLMVPAAVVDKITGVPHNPRWGSAP